MLANVWRQSLPMVLKVSMNEIHFYQLLSNRNSSL